MAQDEKQESGEEPKAVSLKDEILGKIRQGDEKPAAAPSSGGSSSSMPAAAPTFASGGSLRTMSVFCRQLSTMLDVGIPLLRSLQILGQRTSNERLKPVLQDVAKKVEEGQPLSAAMYAHPKTFSSAFVSVVRVGESGGILENSLGRLADVLERRLEIRRRVLSAVMYPMMALLVELAVIVIVLTYALPRLVDAFPSEEELPVITQWVMGMSAWLQANWVYTVAGIAAVIVLFVLWKSSTGGRAAWQRFILGVPIIGDINRKINVANFSRSLGSLVAAGVPLIDALGISADTSDNAVVRRTLHRVRDTVERGGKMDDPMRSEPIFEPMVVDMVMVGDESGALDTMLLKIADNYDSEVDNTLRLLTSILEPILIVIMGFAVGFIAIAVFVPYLSLVRSSSLY